MGLELIRPLWFATSAPSWLSCWIVIVAESVAGPEAATAQENSADVGPQNDTNAYGSSQNSQSWQGEAP